MEVISTVLVVCTTKYLLLPWDVIYTLWDGIYTLWWMERTRNLDYERRRDSAKVKKKKTG